MSTDDQAENGYNLREQEKRIDQYIKAYQEEFPEKVIKYIDDGFSAKDLKRREMSMLIKDIQEGYIHKVVVHNLDRLTRSMKDLLYIIELFEIHDVQLFSLKEKIDTKTAMGRFFVSMIILIAQWEREAISERTIRAMDQSAFEGNWVNGKAPFGYSIIEKKLVVDTYQALVVEEIYNMYYYKELSINSIYHYLQCNLNVFNFKWSYDRVKGILTNEIYTGTYRNKRITLENHSPSIISKKLYAEAQNMLKHRNRRNNHRYLFKGKCYSIEGNKLIVDLTLKEKAIYKYYVCKISRKRINEELININIAPYMNEFIDKEASLTIKRIVSNLKNKDNMIKEVKYLLDLGIITFEYYIEKLSEINMTVDNLEKIISDILKKITYWEELKDNEKILLIKKGVKEIQINLNDNKIFKVTFL